MRRRPLLVAALAVAALLLLAVLIAWIVRFRVATAIVDRKLAAAHVPASYRIIRIGPFLERMENVRIGDAASPDLVAKTIEVSLGYSFSGPVVRAISVDGVRLRAKIDQNGLSLGAIDRLLPQSQGGKTKLPDLKVTLADTQIELATPNGAITAAIAGTGNPAHLFRGKTHVTAPVLRLASCALDGVQADLNISVESGKPAAAGPVTITHSACPGLTLGAGRARMAMSANATFDQVKLQTDLAGFGGVAGPARFAGVTGSAAAAGKLGDLGVKARIGLTGLALPDIARQVAGFGRMLAGTPVGPTVGQATTALAKLLYGSDAQADVEAAIHGLGADFHLRQATLTGRDGAHLTATEGGGMSWTAQGWRADADIATGGGALPVMAVQLRQSAPSARLTGTARIAPYAAGNARIAATPVLFAWDGRKADVQTQVTIDGPFNGGFVQALVVPVRGYATSAGAFAVGPGCQTVAFRQLRLTSFTFDAARLPLCGQPIVARGPGGGLRVDASTGPVRLTGHTSSGAPVALGAARLRLTARGFTAQDLTATLGGPSQPTRLAVATLDGTLDGTLRNGTIGGQFAKADGAIGNVPLDIADASGRWAFEGGTLHLTGALRVSDADEVARFNPLMTDDAVLALRGGTIAATAILREPTTHSEVAYVSLAHDLSDGTGHALLDVPGITFVPKGLQPEKLTPLTLGVIANVAGTVSGSGRIDWSAKGVTSSGTFGTDRIDLAAAFGPVTGIKGQLHFTDLLGLVSAPNQEATIAEINPGVSVTNGVVHYQLIGQSRVQVEDANWPFAGGDLSLDPSTLDFGATAERHLTFRIKGLDAAAFIQQLDFPNIAATGTFDGVLPMIFDQTGGRIEAGEIVARKGGGTLAYVGELSNAQLGTMGKLAFDALKAIRYSSLDISLDGRLDGEMVSRVHFTGVREATPEQSLVTRLIRNLPFRFNITIKAPFRGLVGSARAYIDPRLLLTQVPAPQTKPTPAEPPIQPKDSGVVR